MCPYLPHTAPVRLRRRDRGVLAGVAPPVWLLVSAGLAGGLSGCADHPSDVRDLDAATDPRPDFITFEDVNPIPDVPCDCVNGVCSPGASFCSSCTRGSYGPDCAETCACLNGSCRDGVEGDGRCFCADSWTGDDCSICPDGRLLCDGRCVQPGQTGAWLQDAPATDTVTAGAELVQRFTAPEAGLLSSAQVHLIASDGPIRLTLESASGAFVSSQVTASQPGFYTFVWGSGPTVEAGEDLRLLLSPGQGQPLQVTEPALPDAALLIDDVPPAGDPVGLRLRVSLAGCPGTGDPGPESEPAGEPAP